MARVITDFSELTAEEFRIHAWYSVHIVCDRGVSHELVRHRDASFAQESTRYCNYSRGKYDSEITVIEPFFYKGNSLKYNKWKAAMHIAERAYMELLALDSTPQEARSVLPNSLKTEIVITAPVYEWIHIFNLRVKGTTGAPHPQMKEVMEPIYNEMKDRGIVQ
jgi:thymidylate synthase (FAD)